MATVYNMDSKLEFNENPVIEIKGHRLEVNADARTMLRIMGEFDSNSEISAILHSYELLFSDRAREVIDDMKLSMKDLGTLVETAMMLAQGEDPDAEQETASDSPSVL